MNYYKVYTKGGNIIGVISSWNESAMHKVCCLYGYSMEELSHAIKTTKEECDRVGMVSFGI